HPGLAARRDREGRAPEQPGTACGVQRGGARVLARAGLRWSRAVSDSLAARYYLDLAAAFVRRRLPEAPAGSAEDLVRLGLEAGLRLHKFKRSAELPRVRRVLGMLRGLAPADLLDVGSGRGVFLWPLLDTFPELPVHATDTRPDRVADIQAVARGGIARL